eukprot:72566_1
MSTSIAAQSSQLTGSHGINPGGFDTSWVLSQGRISGIQHWGATNGYESIKIKSWSADSKSQYKIPEFGGYSIVSSCPPFTLPDDQYIDGYRVKYHSTDGVRYLGFHISNGSTFECSQNNVTNLHDTQWIIYNNPPKQLTGYYGADVGLFGR